MSLGAMNIRNYKVLLALGKQMSLVLLLVNLAILSTDNNHEVKSSGLLIVLVFDSVRYQSVDHCYFTWHRCQSC